jgi:crotonobetainyl-CoA:carnitine CoA-transferase CaiB-like acyl-CoA transferase
MTGALDGIRILDFTRYQQGPYATVMLGDMGADVIKIEDPDSGDYGRRLWREPDGFSGFWEALDRGKKSVCVDLTQPGASEIILRLSDTADVVVENFRPGTMEKWGLGFDTLRERNPRLIYGQATGWGTRGEMARMPSFDQIAQAFSGYAQHAGGGPGHTPEIPVPGVADQSGAMNFAFGIMTALFARERTGKGQRVEVSLLGTQIALQAPQVTHYLHFGWEREREFRASPTTGHYQCADGRWVMIVGIDQKFWPRICEAIETPELLEDPKYKSGYPRFVNRVELEERMGQAFARRDSAYILQRLRNCDVPASLVHDMSEMTGHDQVVANDYVVEQEHPRFGAGRVVGLHVQLSETPGTVGSPAPALGQHTVEVLESIGYSANEIASLRSAGVIGH